MLEFADDRRPAVMKALLIATVIIFAATRFSLLFRYTEYVSDVSLHQNAASQVIGHDLAPYCDFHYPYPPLALPLAYLPGLVSLHYPAYRDAFRLEMFAFDLAGFALAWLFLARRVKARPWARFGGLSLYSFLSLAVGHLIYDRIDVVLMVCVAAAVYLFTGAPSRRKWAYAVLAAGTLVKVMPAFLLPLFFVFEELAPGGTPGVAERTATVATYFFAPIAVFIGIYVFAICPDLVSSMQDHVRRGIQLESTWATPFALARVLIPGVDIGTNYSYGAFHLTGRIPPLYDAFSKHAGVLALAGAYGLIAGVARGRKTSGPERFSALLALAVYASVSLIIATQRVLSPQFMIWLIPGAAWLVAIVDGRWKMAAVFAALFAATYGIFDRGFGALLEFQPWVVWLAAGRNLLLLLWSASLITMVIRETAALPARGSTQG